MSASVLSREQLLAAVTLPVERLHIPELGGHVFVRGMTGHERDSWEASLIRGRGKKREVNTQNVRAKLAVRCLCDERGERLFKDHEADLLGGIRVDVLQRIYEAAQRLSGVSDQDADELEQSSAPTTPEPGSTSRSV